MKIGDRVTITDRGQIAAREKHVLASTGTIVDQIIGRRGYFDQIYVKRDNGGCEWWMLDDWAVAYPPEPAP